MCSRKGLRLPCVGSLRRVHKKTRAAHRSMAGAYRACSFSRVASRCGTPRSLKPPGSGLPRPRRNGRACFWRPPRECRGGRTLSHSRRLRIRPAQILLRPAPPVGSGQLRPTPSRGLRIPRKGSSEGQRRHEKLALDRDTAISRAAGTNFDFADTPYLSSKYQRMAYEDAV